MTRTKPTELLKEEHRIIQKVVAAMVVLADRLEMGKEVDPNTLTQVAEFMRLFADQCHERREETVLFPTLQDKGLSVHSCPMKRLVEEHGRGRLLVSGLTKAARAYTDGDSSAREPLLRSLRGLTALYPLHIWQEDQLLFHLAERMLGREEEEELRARLEAGDGESAETRRRGRQLAEEIEQGSW